MDAFRTHTAEDLAAGVFGDDWRRWPTAEGLEGPNGTERARPLAGLRHFSFR